MSAGLGAAWDAATLDAYAGWRFTLSENALSELDAVARDAEGHYERITAERLDALSLPTLRAFVAALDRELRAGCGLAHVAGADPSDLSAYQCAVVALGVLLGGTIDTYGRLYDVVDTGQSYKAKAIPISQTRASTGMHTDSSRLETWPELIALACVRPAAEGGDSRVSSVARAMATLRDEAPASLARLQRPFLRDIVTPGAARGPEEVRKNRFPIVCSEAPATLRYMRYWIERGHTRAEEPLDGDALGALDDLDSALTRPGAVHSFRLSAGEMLFANNRTIVHDRAAYTSDLDAPRHLLRLWIRERDSAHTHGTTPDERSA